MMKGWVVGSVGPSHSKCMCVRMCVCVCVCVRERAREREKANEDKIWCVWHLFLGHFLLSQDFFLSFFVHIPGLGLSVERCSNLRQPLSAWTKRSFLVLSICQK